MQDFSCKAAKDMHYPELANSVKHFKEEGGREEMCEAVEKFAKEYAKEYAVQVTIEDAISYGMSKEAILNKVNQKYGVSMEEAEELYEQILNEK